MRSCVCLRVPYLVAALRKFSDDVLREARFGVDLHRSTWRVVVVNGELMASVWVVAWWWYVGGEELVVDARSRHGLPQALPVVHHVEERLQGARDDSRTAYTAHRTRTSKVNTRVPSHAPHTTHVPDAPTIK